MPKPTIEDHKLFIQLVDAGNFYKAAQNLKLSASAVSRHLQKLERELDTNLLNRTTRSISLTEQGKIFYESCVRIEEEKQNTLKRLQDLNASPQGHLKIAATPTFAHSSLIPALAQFSETYPDISFELHTSDEFVDLVEAGFDVALRIGDLRDSRLKARRLMRSNLVCCASSEYIQGAGEPIDFKSLSEHQLIFTSHLSAVERRYLHAFPDFDIQSLQKKLIVNSVLASYQAVCNGMGVTFLPQYLVQKDISSGALVELFQSKYRLPHEIYILFQNAKSTPAKTRVFIDYLVDRFKE